MQYLESHHSHDDYEESFPQKSQLGIMNIPYFETRHRQDDCQRFFSLEEQALSSTFLAAELAEHGRAYWETDHPFYFLLKILVHRKKRLSLMLFNEL